MAGSASQSTCVVVVATSTIVGTAALGGRADTAAIAPPNGLPFLRDYAGRDAPSAITTGSPLPKLGGAAVAVNIDTRQVLRSLPRALYGNNPAAWDGSLLVGRPSAALGP